MLEPEIPEVHGRFSQQDGRREQFFLQSFLPGMAFVEN